MTLSSSGLDRRAPWWPTAWARYPAGRCCCWRPEVTKPWCRISPARRNTCSEPTLIGSTRRYLRLEPVSVSTITGERCASQFCWIVNLNYFLPWSKYRYIWRKFKENKWGKHCCNNNYYYYNFESRLLCFFLHCEILSCFPSKIHFRNGNV